MDSAYFACFSLFLSKCVASFSPMVMKSILVLDYQCLLKFNVSQIIFQMTISLELSI